MASAATIVAIEHVERTTMKMVHLIHCCMIQLSWTIRACVHPQNLEESMSLCHAAVRDPSARSMCNATDGQTTESVISLVQALKL